MVYHIKEGLLRIIGKIICAEKLFEKQINDLREIADKLNENVLNDSQESIFLEIANKNIINPDVLFCFTQITARI